MMMPNRVKNFAWRASKGVSSKDFVSKTGPA